MSGLVRRPQPWGSVARADLIAFTDDDVRVSSTWIQSIVRAFNENSDVDMVGGKVEPAWEEPPPPWLLETGDAPLALVDFGEHAFRITQQRGVCLIGANVAVRRRAFERAGGFSIALQRVRDSVGSMEDYDFQVRVLAGGVSALYEPRIVAHALVPRERLMKRVSPCLAQGSRRLLSRSCATRHSNAHSLARSSVFRHMCIGARFVKRPHGERAS